MAVIDCETGNSDQLLVPFPHMPQEQFELLPDDLVEFTFHDISTMTLVGERQLWAGTNSGTLHIFELASSPSCNSSFRLKDHSLIKINEPILSMACRPVEYVFPSDSPLTNVLKREGVPLQDARDWRKKTLFQCQFPAACAMFSAVKRQSLIHSCTSRSLRHPLLYELCC